MIIGYITHKGVGHEIGGISGTDIMPREQIDAFGKMGPLWRGSPSIDGG